MSDWSSELGAALDAGDPHYMRAMLARVPKEVLQSVAPFLEHMAAASEKEGRLEECLSYHEQLVQAEPDQAARHAQYARVLLVLERTAEALSALQAAARLEPANDAVRQTIDALETAMRKDTLHVELPAPPRVLFDPALLDDPAMPASVEGFRVEGLRQLLLRYSGQLSPGNAIARLEDPLWLDAWDSALAELAGARVLMRGSELGVFALRALRHGAAHVLCAQACALDARIATGIAQKHFLAGWHGLHGAAVQGWSEEVRRASFEQFAGGIDIVVGNGPAADAAPFDCLVFPGLDHTLLGTGIVRAVRAWCAGRAVPARVLPARATVFAMGIEWTCPGAEMTHQPLGRWSMYPQALELAPQMWAARTDSVRAGEIDFENFAETVWDLSLPVTGDGRVDAIVFWFELELGAQRISNAPGSALRCIKPAVQYTDPFKVRRGEAVQLRARVEASRLYFETRPAAALHRTQLLPAWLAPMLGDARRSDAYRGAIRDALARAPGQMVLDVGAGCGLLAMAAAQAGAGSVVGCESNRAVLKAGREIVALAGLADRVALLDKDCRKLQVPGDLPRRADLALFESFDCSLIGEGVLHFLAHARAHLLAPHARIVPAAARIRAMLIEYRVERIWDIDATLFNPYRASTSFINVDAGKLAWRALSDPFDVFAFDFTNAGPEPQEQSLQLAVSTAGTAGAVLFWFDLGLDQDTWISNAPDASDAAHWKQGLQFLPEVRVEAGMVVPLMARHNGSALAFQWQADGLPRDALSKLPMCDPRWVAASADIEQQTGSLLQHCAQHPDEYLKVAQIAQRFAIDPGAWDLDPAIAQRFAAMFISGE
jgi:protein arginine N-methyltransferase 7